MTRAVEDGRTVETRAVWPGELELRQRGRVLSGTFPYSRGSGDRMATVRDRGRVRKERIAGDAFGWQLARFEELQAELSGIVDDALDSLRAQAIRQELERRNTHILVGHDFGKPLGDRLRGTARVESNRERLRFEVDLPAEADQPTYMRDALAQVRAGLAGGISPGFRVPPRAAVPDAEILEPEPGNPAVQVRVVRAAVLPELSIVTRPVYSETSLDVRAEDVGRVAVPPRRRVRVWL